MCQLTFITTTVPELGKYFLYLASIYNTDIKNKDGWGVYCPTSVITKNVTEPLKSLDTVRDTIFNLPDYEEIAGMKVFQGLLHVRQATTGYVKDKILSLDHTHPFEGENYVLAHNGTLTPENGEIPQGMMDSQFFHQELEKNWDPDPVVALNKTMANFTGKFAFIIYDKITKEFIIARGETADLHYSTLLLDGEDIGFVVNTELYTAKNALAEVGRKMLWDHGKVLEYDLKNLRKNTVQRCWYSTDGLWDIFPLEGLVPEKAKKVVYPLANTPTNSTVWERGGDIITQGTRRTTTETNFFSTPLVERNTHYNFLMGFMRRNFLYLPDIDKLSLYLVSAGIYELTKESFISFVDKLTLLEENYYQKDSYEEWTKIERRRIEVVPQYEFCEQFGISFPFFLNSEATLKAVKKELMVITNQVDDRRLDSIYFDRFPRVW